MRCWIIWGLQFRNPAKTSFTSPNGFPVYVRRKAAKLVFAGIGPSLSWPHSVTLFPHLTPFLRLTEGQGLVRGRIAFAKNFPIVSPPNQTQGGPLFRHHLGWIKVVGALQARVMFSDHRST